MLSCACLLNVLENSDECLRHCGLLCVEVNGMESIFTIEVLASGSKAIGVTEKVPPYSFDFCKKNILFVTDFLVIYVTLIFL